ncbi:hypothetical protein F8M41_001461 [Gigaspora margarita]|uniref:Uncharacterized protein n=1 Tax=Gigaspora margarita TaxID=4874 RepID=A0A8H3XFZ2_GIGMA|nr:hypothetical protein F8M41_001461 [Gigaspora margarita]
MEKGKAIKKEKNWKMPCEKTSEKGANFIVATMINKFCTQEKKEYKTGKSASMGKIHSALKYTTKYTSKESSDNKSVVSVEEAPK